MINSCKKYHMRKRLRAAGCSAAALVLTAALLFPGSAVFADTGIVSDSAEEASTSRVDVSHEEQPVTYADEIRSARISADGASIEVFATLSEETAGVYEGKRLYLLALCPYQSVENIGAFDPVGYLTVSGCEYRFKLPFAPNTEQVFSRYLCAVLDDEGNYTVLTSEKYIENYSDIAPNRYAYPDPVSKKGLAVQLVADAQLLGVSNTVIGVNINEYFTSDTENGAAFDYNGKTYYINPVKLAVLDHRIKTYTDADINIYLDILLTAPTESQPEELDCLYCSEFSSSVTYYALNSADKTALGYFEAFMSFLAGRYTAPDGSHGFAGSYIIGYEVNSNRYYNNMGEQTLDEYTDSYARLLRTAAAAVGSVYSEARVYVSLSNNFNDPSINPKIKINDRLDYTSRDILDALAEKAGDVPWNVAFYPYASEYDMTEIWNDGKAISGFATPYITMANIEVLCEYLGQESFLIDGKPRSIAIAEFGVSAEPDNAEALEKQAAAFAYAYYKAAALDTVESVIYYRHVDNRYENGVFFGLWRYGEGEDDIQGSSKPIYDVFRYIDTQRSAEFSDKYLGAAGLSGWDAAVPGFNISNYTVRTVETSAASDIAEIPGSYGKYNLFDFTDGVLYGFKPTENASYIDIREASGLTNRDGSVRRASTMYAELVNAGSGEYMGVSRSFKDGLNLEEVRFISFNIKAEASVSTSAVKVMFRLISDGSKDESAGYDVYEGVAEIPAGEWTAVSFDISAATSKHTRFDHMTVWIADGDGNRTDQSYSFWLSDVNVYKKDMSRITRIVLIAVLAAAAVLAVGCLVGAIKVISFRRRKKLEEKRIQAEAEKAAYRQAELARRREIAKMAEKVAAEQGGKKYSGQSALRKRIDGVKSSGKRNNKQ